MLGPGRARRRSSSFKLPTVTPGLGAQSTPGRGGRRGRGKFKFKFSLKTVRLERRGGSGSRARTVR